MPKTSPQSHKRSHTLQIWTRFYLFLHFIYLTFLPNSLFAQIAPSPSRAHRVVLLISIDFSNHPFLTSTQFQRLPGFLRQSIRGELLGYPERLAHEFEATVRSENYLDPAHGARFTPWVIQNADQYTSWVESHNPENAAVFWISHAGDPNGLLADVALAGPIADYQGFDVSEIFQDLGQSIRAFGIIGCGSSNIVDHVIRRQSLTTRFPGVFISAGNFGYTNGSIELEAAVHNALLFFRRQDQQRRERLSWEQSQRILRDRQETHLPKLNPDTEWPLTRFAHPNQSWWRNRGGSAPWAWEEVSVTITRHFRTTNSDQNRGDVVFPAVRITDIHRSIVAVLPSGHLGDPDQQAQVLLRRLRSNFSNESNRNDELTLQMTTGANSQRPLRSIDLGEFEVHSTLPAILGQWQIRRTPSGIPLGVISREFNFTEITGP